MLHQLFIKGNCISSLIHIADKVKHVRLLVIITGHMLELQAKISDERSTIS